MLLLLWPALLIPDCPRDLPQARLSRGCQISMAPPVQVRGAQAHLPEDFSPAVTTSGGAEAAVLLEEGSDSVVKRGKLEQVLPPPAS